MRYEIERYLKIPSASNPVWVADGNSIAYISNHTGVPQIWLVRAEGGEPQVDRITRPLMVIHGRNDPRVPVGEAEQIVESLVKRGKEVEYLCYEDEGHGVVKFDNKLDCYSRAASFLKRHLQVE